MSTLMKVPITLRHDAIARGMTNISKIAKVTKVNDAELELFMDSNRACSTSLSYKIS